MGSSNVVEQKTGGTSKRLAALIQKGQQVVDTDRPPPPNIGRPNTVDGALFNEWRSQAESFLYEHFGAGHPYLTGFTERCQQNFTYQAEAGNAILRAAKEDIDDDHNSGRCGRLKSIPGTSVDDVEHHSEHVAKGRDSRSTAAQNEVDARESRGPSGLPIPANLADSIQQDPRAVFVVHGRNKAARDAMFDFLRALDLSPIEWEQAVAWTGKASPYIGEVLEAAFTRVQAVVVIVTGDDEGHLREQYRLPDESDHLEPQPRLNVVFEAGMALGLQEARTILVEIGQTRTFSDIAGRHVVRIADAAPNVRTILRGRLRSVGCPILEYGEDWLRNGDFNAAIASSNPFPPAEGSIPANDSNQCDADAGHPSQSDSSPLAADTSTSWTGIVPSFRRGDDIAGTSERDDVLFVLGNYGSTTFVEVTLEFLDPLVASEGEEISASAEFRRTIQLLKPDQEVKYRFEDAESLGLAWYMRDLRDSYRVNVRARNAKNGEVTETSHTVALSSVFTTERAGPWRDERGRAVPASHPWIETEADPHPDNIAADDWRR